MLGLLGVAVRHFPLMLAGMALFGIASTSNLLARYAAADVSRPERRGRAMGIIVGGSALGSIIGPNLMAPALALGAHLGVPDTASPFLVSVAGYGVAAVLTFLFLRPDPLALARQPPRRPRRTRAGPPASPARSARSSPTCACRSRSPRLSISQFVMISTTSTSPLYLHDQGHTVGTIGVAVSLHLAGMYVASPLSGWLSDRFGRMPVIASGALMLIFAVALAGLAPGQAGATIILGLFLNGVGWNLAFVSGSALLTDALSPASAPRSRAWRTCSWA